MVNGTERILGSGVLGVGQTIQNLPNLSLMDKVRWILCPLGGCRGEDNGPAEPPR